nr:hypothetical protein [uncultured Acetobacterium sp.]
MAKVINSSYLTKRHRYQIQTTIHEGALAVSGEISWPVIQFEKIQPMIAVEFKTLAAWVDQRGGIVGHIKGVIITPEKSMMFSTTGAEVQCHFWETKDEPKDNGQIRLTGIVFNIPQLELEEKLMAIFDRLEKSRK